LIATPIIDNEKIKVILHILIRQQKYIIRMHQKSLDEKFELLNKLDYLI